MSRKRYHDHLHGHRKKRRYPTKFAARRKAVSMFLHGKPGLHPYSCTWGRFWEDGTGHELHWHIGHRPRWLRRKGFRQRCWFWWHRLVVWNMYKARRQYRKLIGYDRWAR